jgi:hypothetical protein
VDIAPVYSEGEEEAFRQLYYKIQKLKDCLCNLRSGNSCHNKKRIKDTKGRLLVDSYY